MTVVERKFIELSGIVYDAKIYPREKWSSHTVKVYVDALKGGAEFPPIILEEGTNRLIDGVHRWKAYQDYLAAYREAEKETQELEGWAEPKTEIEAEWHTIPDGIPAKLYAAQFSCEHGDRITPAERKALAREVYEAHPDFVLETLREHLKVSVGTAHSYVADILARRKEEKKMTAYRLNLLGWTQEEIGEVVGMSRQWVDKNLPLFSTLKKVAKNLLSEGHPHLDVAERYNMPLILVWAIDLSGHTDQERMNKLGIKIQPYDHWSFSTCHDLFGATYPGRIPGQLVAHALYFYTEPGAMVFDPMAGSGTTIDVCLAMGRQCYAYDASPKRLDIMAQNLKGGWADRLKKADLVFWDPPYFKKVDKGYSGESISRLGRERYLSFFSERLTEAHQLVKKGAKLAFLMSDWNDEQSQSGIFLWDYADIIRQAGWRLIRHIQTPLSTQQIHPDIVKKFRNSKRLARLERYLLIAEK